MCRWTEGEETLICGLGSRGWEDSDALAAFMGLVAKCGRSSGWWIVMAKKVERQIGRQLDKIFYYGQFCDIGETIKFYKILKVS